MKRIVGGLEAADGRNPVRHDRIPKAPFQGDLLRGE